MEDMQMSAWIHIVHCVARCLSPDCQMGGLGCDNMTCVLVCFLHDKPYQDLVERCAKISRAREAAFKENSAGETEEDEEEELEEMGETEDTDSHDVT